MCYTYKCITKVYLDTHIHTHTGTRTCTEAKFNEKI